MPKKRRRSSASLSRSINTHAAHQINMLIAALVVVFLLASVFNKAGVVGGYIHEGMAMALGMATPLVAAGIFWLIGRYFWPDKLTYQLLTTLGVILFVLTLTGILHSIIKTDPLEAARLGQGGGMLGYLVLTGIKTMFGSIFGLLLLFIGLFISLILIFDRAILPFFHQNNEEEDMDEDGDSRVRVVGELKTSPLGLIRRKLSKAQVVTELPDPKKMRDIARPLSRTANWNYPPVELLELIEMKPQAGNIQKKMETIKKSLLDFGIDVAMTDVNIGPTVTQYTLKPAEGVKLNQITARRDDLALALSAQSLRVEAPIPGKGLVGIEIPNEKKAMVGLRDLLETKTFKQAGSKLAIALGRDVAGEPVVADLSKMPHALIAGSTGSGKSVAINSIILSLLINNSPDELRMILIDPKRVELIGYNGLPHLLTPVIIEAKETVSALGWAVREMERRYKLLSSLGKRNIDLYNEAPDMGEGKMPYIVIIIDELADLMMVAAREVESSIVRLAQMARAVGIHLIVATQRPSVDVITGLIKANVPTRLAFAVASQIDSRTIIDMAGAEKLLGNGDMLYQNTESPSPKRVQGVFASEKEINAVIAHIKMQEDGDRYEPSVLETRVESRLGGSRENGEIDDELFKEAYEVVKQAGKASSTLLQTRLSVGYARAARLIQAMEDQGLVGPAKGSKPREVYGAETGSHEDVGIAAYPENE